MEKKMEESIETQTNAVAFYFNRVKGLELTEPYLYFFNSEAKEVYKKEIRQVYDVLFDRIMTTDTSPFLKQELEHWYEENKSHVGTERTAGINRDLENILLRMDFL